jgi:nitrate reductase alpha subunit
VREGRTDVYLQRILDNSTNTKGYKIDELEAKAKEGVPALLMSRTSPKSVGHEQDHDSRPWYTKSGRLEFYRDENEFIEAGENLPVHREPIDSTFYEPNVIVAPKHEAIRPRAPRTTASSATTNRARSAARPQRGQDLGGGEGVAASAREGRLPFIFHTPKYRHGSHTTPIDTDMIAVSVRPVRRRLPPRQAHALRHRRLRRHPSVGREGARRRGRRLRVDRLRPSDRPFRGWQQNAKDYKFARCMARARYYPGTPRGVTRMWFNMYGATPGSVEGQATRKPTGWRRIRARTTRRCSARVRTNPRRAAG